VTKKLTALLEGVRVLTGCQQEREEIGELRAK